MNEKKYELIRIFYNKDQIEKIVNGTTDNIQDALNYAVMHANLETIEHFVKLGADVKYNNSTVLLYATMIKSPYYTNEKILKYLINQGANIEVIRNTRHPAISKWIDDNY